SRIDKHDTRSLALRTSLRLESQMQGLCSVLQHSRGQDRSMRGKTEHRRQTPATSLRQGHHRSYRSDRKETRYTLHAWLQNILDRNDRLQLALLLLPELRHQPAAEGRRDGYDAAGGCRHGQGIWLSGSG